MFVDDLTVLLFQQISDITDPNRPTTPELMDDCEGEKNEYKCRRYDNYTDTCRSEMPQNRHSFSSLGDK